MKHTQLRFWMFRHDLSSGDSGSEQSCICQLARISGQHNALVQPLCANKSLRLRYSDLTSRASRGWREPQECDGLNLQVLLDLLKKNRRMPANEQHGVSNCALPQLVDARFVLVPQAANQVISRGKQE